MNEETDIITAKRVVKIYFNAQDHNQGTLNNKSHLADESKNLEVLTMWK